MVSAQEIKPETIQRLASLAEAHGYHSIDEYVAAIAANGKSVLRGGLTAAEKAQQWEDWVNAHLIDAPHNVDVSRASIYTREDVAL